MSTLKISKHSDVPSALDLVKEEVDKEAKRIFSAGGDALKAGKIRPVTWRRWWHSCRQSAS